MPTTRRQTAEQCRSGVVIIKVKWLRIEFLGEFLNFCFRYQRALRRKFLAGVEIFEVQFFCHCDSC
jgi:hypothetical protein